MTRSSCPRIRVNGTDSPQTVLQNVRNGTAGAGSYA